MANRERKNREFTDAEDRLTACGVKITYLDATEKFAFEITQRMIDKAIGHQEDESYCVVAQGVRAATPLLIYLSIGECVSKILYYDLATVYRYSTSEILKRAIKVWDLTGEWPLPPDVYYLLKPTGKTRLRKNWSQEQKDKEAVRVKKYLEKLEANGPTGAGWNKHSGRTLSTRQIAVIRTSR